MSGNVISGINNAMSDVAVCYSNQVSKTSSSSASKSIDKKEESSRNSAAIPQFASRGLSNVSIKFQVNASTNDVTILVLDKASKEAVSYTHLRAHET